LGTELARDKTIEAVLTKHNYLSSAYNILTKIEAQEKYYPYIKDMATRPRRLDRYEGYELAFMKLNMHCMDLPNFRERRCQIIKEIDETFGS
jgi:hypothetical protein